MSRTLLVLGDRCTAALVKLVKARIAELDAALAPDPAAAPAELVEERESLEGVLGAVV